MTISEIRDALLAARPLEQITGELTPKRMSDALRHGVRTGHLRRVRRGVYEVVPDRMSRTTRWRYRNWVRRFDEMEADRTWSP